MLGFFSVREKQWTYSGNSERNLGVRPHTGINGIFAMAGVLQASYNIDSW